MKASWLKEIVQIIRSVLFFRSGGQNAGSEYGWINRKIFIKEFILIFLVCSLLFVGIFSYYAGSLIKSEEAGRLATYQMHLDAISEYVSSALYSSIDSTLQQVYQSMAITGISLTTAEHHILKTTITRVRGDLLSSIGNSSVFSEALLYVPKAELCITSSGAYGRPADLAVRYRGLLENYITDRSKRIPMPVNDEHTYVYRLDKQLCFVDDMVIYEGEPQSLLFVLVDQETLYQNLKRIFSINAEDAWLYAFDSFGYPLWKDSISYPANIETDDHMIKSTSVWPDWCFYMEAPQLELSAVFPHMLLYVFLLMLLIFVIALFVSAFLHRPLYRIALALAEINVPLPDRQDAEADVSQYLNRSIRQLNAYQKELDSALSSVSIQLKEKLFMTLLQGKPVTYAAVEQSLRGLRSEFTASALYAALAVRLQKASEDSCVRARQVINELLASFCSEHAISYQALLLPPRPEIAVVIQFNDIDTSIISGKKEILSLLRLIPDTLESKQLSCIAAAGHLYHSIMDIGFSYKEAVDALDGIREPAGIPQADVPEDGMEQRAHRIVQWLAEGNSDAAESMAAPAVEQLLSNHADLWDAWDAGLAFLQMLMNEIGVHEFVNESSIPDEYARLAAEAAPQDMETLRGELTDAIHRMISSFNLLLTKQNNPYILQARTYIEAHLSEPDLSLSSTAEALGLSTSYLSRLFSSHLGVNYSTYVNQVRLDTAMHALLKTNETVSTIAERCGFSSSRNFIYAFKKKYQLTPGEYRKRYGE